MKKFLFVLSVVLFLALLAVPSTPANAASVPCSASPTSGPVGTWVTVTCSGFSPNTYVTAWLTEPDGHAVGVPTAWFATAGGKTDASGDVAFRFFTDMQPYFAVAYGTWTLTVMQGNCATCGPVGKAEFTITGGTEGVSGAMLEVNGSMVSGRGFLPGEVVTVWVDFPNGDCSGIWYLSSPVLPTPMGLGTVIYGNYKADNDGDIAFNFDVGKYTCKGEYHIVARGNASKLGADAYWTTPNRSVTETASLVANPDVVSAYGGHTMFSGWGFGINEPVTCWTTSPQGQVIPIFPGYNSDNDGDLAIGYGTGVDWYGFIQSSEGALGEWAMTCKGNRSGAIGIARYTLIGNEIDP